MTTIHVTQADINAGTLTNALRRVCNRDTFASISGKDWLVFRDYKSTDWLPLPEAVVEKLQRIRNTKPIEPFSFELDLPDWALRTP